ncbi:hypothetical protein AX16_010102, partial [Volvariella volvacea WC 439]
MVHPQTMKYPLPSEGLQGGVASPLPKCQMVSINKGWPVWSLAPRLSMALRGVHSIEHQWGLWSSLAYSIIAIVLSLTDSVTTVVAR